MIFFLYAGWLIVNPNISLNTGSAQNTNTVAGGYGQGNAMNQLSFPYGLAVLDDKTMFISDWGNHRIMRWTIGDTEGQVIAGGHGQGNRLNQLDCPTDVLVDKETNSIIICDRGNKRVVRWSLADGTTEGEILLKNIACWGLAIDDQRFIYISDIEKHEVRQYKIGEKNGTVVAGGQGRGAGLRQLNDPSYIFVDRQQAVYVSDTRNHRVMKWKKDAKEGIVVALGFPRGLFVDTSESIYVADYGNHRLMRWREGEKEGTVIVVENSEGDEENQLYQPCGLSFDQRGHLFVADHSKHRIQRFPLEPAK
jgi:sugar lactone lactonase YvrE